MNQLERPAGYKNSRSRFKFVLFDISQQSAMLGPAQAHSQAQEAHRSPELPDEIEDETYEDADDDARGEGKVKGKMLFFDQDVSRQLSQERHFPDKEQDDADDDQEHAENDDDLRDIAHLKNSFFSHEWTVSLIA
jgi:hypothetical protein